MSPKPEHPEHIRETPALDKQDATQVSRGLDPGFFLPKIKLYTDCFFAYEMFEKFKSI